MQLANYFQAEVTSVSSSKNRLYCQQHGASITLAYDKDDIWNAVEPGYDLVMEVFDQGGKLYKQAKNYLKKGGVFVTLTTNPTAFFKTMFSFALPKRYKQFMIRTRTKDLLLISDLAERKQITPPIQVFGFNDAKKAFEILDTHHATGKIVIAIDETIT